MTQTEDTNGFIPNSFQTPNILVDRVMPLLKPEEYVALSFAVRHILGWEDKIARRRARISLSMFQQCGLPVNTLRTALDALDRFRILRRIGPPTQDGQLWELAFNQPDIDWEGLKQRKARKTAMEKKRTAAARRARAAKRQDEVRSSVGQNTESAEGQHAGTSVRQNTGSSVPQHTGSSVGQNTEPSVGQTTRSSVAHNTGGLWDRRNQTQVLNDDGDPESPDQDHQTNKRAWDEGTRALVAAAWKGMGLSKALREMLLERDPEAALGLVYHARGEAKTNAAGLLRTMLKNGDEPMAKYADRAAWALASEPATDDAQVPVDAMYAEIAARFGPMVADSMRQAEEQRAASEPALSEPSEPSPEVLALDEVGPGQKTSMRSAWLAVMGQLELQLNRSTFDTWLRRAEPARFADGVLTVKVRHAYAPDYIPQHFPDIEAMVTRAAGIPVKVAYECDVKLFNHHLSLAPAAVSKG